MKGDSDTAQKSRTAPTFQDAVERSTTQAIQDLVAAGRIKIPKQPETPVHKVPQTPIRLQRRDRSRSPTRSDVQQSTDPRLQHRIRPPINAHSPMKDSNAIPKNEIFEKYRVIIMNIRPCAWCQWDLYYARHAHTHRTGDCNHYRHCSDPLRLQGFEANMVNRMKENQTAEEHQVLQEHTLRAQIMQEASAAPAQPKPTTTTTQTPKPADEHIKQRVNAAFKALSATMPRDTGELGVARELKKRWQEEAESAGPGYVVSHEQRNMMDRLEALIKGMERTAGGAA